MKREAVKYLVGMKLAEAGIRRYEDAARRLGVTPQHLSAVLACRDMSAPVQQGLADLCGCTPQELFGRYTSPKLARRRKLKSTRGRDCA